MSEGFKGVFLVAVSAIAFGFLPIFTIAAYDSGASTYTVLLLRFTSAAVLMILIMLISHMQFPSIRECILFCIIGAVGYGGQSLCYFSALNYTTAGTVSLILYTFPALVTAGSVIFLKEKFTIYKLCSLIVALTGAFIIIGGQLDTNTAGILLSIGAALIYSTYILINSIFVKPGNGFQSSAFIMLGGAITYSILHIFVDYQPPQDGKGYIAMILVVLVATVLSSWTFFAGLPKIGPSATSLVSTLEPVVTVAASCMLLGETLTLRMIIGGLLIISALLFTLYDQKRAGL